MHVLLMHFVGVSIQLVTIDLIYQGVIKWVTHVDRVAFSVVLIRHAAVSNKIGEGVGVVDHYGWVKPFGGWNTDYIGVHIT